MLLSTLSSTVLTVVRVLLFELRFERVETSFKALDVSFGLGDLGGDVHVVSVWEWVLERFIPLTMI
jgi:hypothetical protein